MFQISVSEFSTYRWSFFQDVLQAARRGFDGIGVWRKKVDDVGADEAIDFLHEMNMSVSSVSWAGGFTGGDGRSYVDAIDDAFDAIDFARQVQADCLVIHPGSLNNHTNRHATRLISGALETLVPFASDNDVRLALEPRFGPSAWDWTFLKEFDQTLDLISEFEPYQVGLVLDLYHVGENEQILSLLGGLASRIALVQVADSYEQVWDEDNRRVPGKGRLPIGRWLNRLAAAGYNGALELEVHGFDVEKMDYGRLLDESMDAMNTLTGKWSQKKSQVVNVLRPSE